MACRPRTARSVLLALYRGPGVRSTEKAADPMHRAITQLFERIRQFLDEVMPEFSARDICLAIENHFEIPSRILAEAAKSYPASLVGFCVDVANSLRNFEDTATVLDLLSTCYLLPLEGLRC